MPPVPDRPPKSRWLALALNFLLPGAGLAYLGFWRAGAVNLALALAAGALATLLLAPETLVEYRSMIGSGIAGGSLGAAYTAYDRYTGTTPA
jgi:hypothetical protein